MVNDFAGIDAAGRNTVGCMAMEPLAWPVQGQQQAGFAFARFVAPEGTADF